MCKYYDNLNPEVKAYFKILSEEFPSWLEEYINTPEMKRIGLISMSCGTDYSKCFNVRYFYSNLDHSVGVALIIWNFTHDKKQALAGLFHDIATPVFKHCIDFMNGDSEHQESTEEGTVEMIKNSKEIMSLLKRDGISLEDVCDYKKYPLADNDSPRLSADRFEYTFSSGLTFYRIWELNEIKKVYNNIDICTNESGDIELCFIDKDICNFYIKTISHLWPQWISDKDRTLMQFFADMCSSLNKIGKLSIDELYSLSEKEVISKFENDSDDYLRRVWNDFKKCRVCHSSDHLIKGKYCINVKSKARYVNPLVLINDKPIRIYDASKRSKNYIDKFLSLPKGGNYTYFNFEFTPYK